MYLNEFNKRKILELIDIIKKNDTTNLVFNIDIDSESKYAILCYSSFLHKICAKDFNPEKEPMFFNNDIKVIVVSAEKFIMNLIPSKEYYNLMSI